MNNLTKRAIGGTAYILIILLGTLGGYIPFTIVFGTISILATYELVSLIRKNQNSTPSPYISVIGSLSLFIGANLYWVTNMPQLLYSIPILLTVLLAIELYRKQPSALYNVATTTLAWVYVGLPMALIPLLIYSRNEGQFHFYYLLPLFVMIWVNDTFAYLSGMLTGKHRLFERISPKKTWEGFIGGLAFTMASSQLFALQFTQLTSIEWLIYALVLVVFGTYGDLFESLLKRALGVKDSGTIVFGHGGILDRFDSTLFAIPAIVTYLLLLGKIA